jgi:hypothetical protein
MGKIAFSPGIEKAFNDVFPVPIKATRAPTSADINFPIGQIWVRTDTAVVYILAQLSSGAASWTLASPGASDVDTLTGDSGGAISPAAGNITLAGGTNVTSAGAGSTVTFNLDAAITLATSVSSPLYTVAAATDLAITAATGQDVVIKMGDNAAGNKVSFIDSDDAEVASIDSNGAFTTTGLTFTGLLTAQASATIETAGTALNLGSDNSGDAVNLGVGTVARAINVGTSAAAHVISIGNASAGAVTIDTAAGVSIDAAAASNFTVAGAGIDLTLASGSGRVIVNGEEAAANAITLLSAAGGIDADCALQMNLTSSQNAADAVRINASAGGIDIDAAGAAGEDITIDNAAGSISITSGESIANSLVLTAGGGLDILAPSGGAGLDIDITNTGGSINVSATEADAAAISIQASAGGIDVDGALQINVTSSQNAADAVRINASAGGIDIDAAGAAGEDITIDNAAGSIVLTAGEAAADALSLQSTGGVDVDGALQVNIASSQNAADAVRINASAGGIDIDAAGAAGEDITIDNAAGSIVLTSGEAIADSLVLSSGGGMDILAPSGGAGLDIDITNTGGSVNITASESVTDAIVINASGAAGGVDIQAGTNGINLASGLIMSVVNKDNGDTPYTLLGTDYCVSCDTSAGVLTITLPASPATGRTILVVDEGGSAGANNITVSGNGKNIAGGGSLAATDVIDSNYGTMLLIYNGTFWNALDVA